MVILIEKSEHTLRRFKTLRPKCRQCERDLYEYIQQKETEVWRIGSAGGRTSHRTRYYCDDCKKDLFEGVKLR